MPTQIKSVLMGFILVLNLAGCSGGMVDANSGTCADVSGSLIKYQHGGLSGVIETLAGSGANATDQVDADANGTVDCAIPAVEANFDTPLDVCAGPDDTLYIVDWNGHKIRSLTADGTVSFVAGTGVEGDKCEDRNADGTCPALEQQLNHMTDIIFDAEGRMVVAAWHNSKIKRVDFTTNITEDVCGTGNRQFAGDGGPCEDAGVDLVAFDLPSSVAYDAAGNLFIADQANQIIRRLGTDGIVKTVVGDCPGKVGTTFGCPDGQGYEGDGGPATAAKLNNDFGQGTTPQGKLTFDIYGNLLIADTGNSVIRKVVPGADGSIGDGDAGEEIITTVAGSGIAGYAGDGGLATEAELNSPSDVDVAADGSIFIADTLNNCIRKVDPAGIISTYAGRCGEAGSFAGDGGLATEASLNNPYGVEVDGEGNLHIADTLNYRIRIVYP